jgi:toxin-antitoxin system protein
LSQQTNRPVSFYINAILEEHLDDLEYAYLLKSEAEDIRAGRAKSYSLDSVKKELGL